MHRFLFAMLIFSCVSCATASMIEPHTAMPLGANNHQIQVVGGYTPLVAFAYDYGLAEKLDLGLNIEFQNEGIVLVGADGKYNFLSSEKTPVSVVAGVGGGPASFYWYGGPIVSFFATRSYEMAFNLRYNAVKWSFNAESTSDDASNSVESFFSDLTDEIINEISGIYQYASFNWSNTFWLSDKKWGITLSTTVNHMFDPLDFVFYGANLGFQVKL